MKALLKLLRCYIKCNLFTNATAVVTGEEKLFVYPSKSCTPFLNKDRNSI